MITTEKTCYNLLQENPKTHFAARNALKKHGICPYKSILVAK